MDETKTKINLKALSITVAVCLIFSALSAFGVYYVMNQKLEKQRAEAENQKIESDKQIAETKKALEEKKETEKVTLATPDQILDLFYKAKLTLNYEEASKYFTSNAKSSDRLKSEVLENHAIKYQILTGVYSTNTTYKVSVKEIFSEEPCQEEGPCIQNFNIPVTLLKTENGWLIDEMNYPDGLGKPAIYLYPNSPLFISVKVQPDGGFTKTIPSYGEGWNVFAEPDGKITYNGNNYPYLFWEGNSYDLNIPSEGFVVKREEVASFLDQKLSFLGLNIKEAADFKEFWLPRMDEKPYYFVNFIPKEEIDRIAPLNISPSPDTVIRVLMSFKGLEKPIFVEEQRLESTQRKGFVVVEWGGIF